MGDSAEITVDSTQPEVKQQEKGDRATYANRNSRLRIARIIEEAPSTPKHPYVSIIRGREIESVESFASGVIDILRLHGNVIAESSGSSEEAGNPRKSRSTDVVYVISQADIEKAVKASSRSYPLSTTQILNIMNITMEGNSRAIFKITTDFSKNIISPVNGENLSSKSKAPIRTENNRRMFGMATTTIGTYFGAATFFALAGLNGAIYYFLVYLKNLPLSDNILSHLLPVALSLTVLSLIIRIGGFWAYGRGEKIAFTISAILFGLSFLLYFVYKPELGNYHVIFTPLITTFNQLDYQEEFFALYSAVMSLQIGLFAYNHRHPFFGISAGILSGVFSALFFSVFFFTEPSFLQGFGFGFFLNPNILGITTSQQYYTFYLMSGVFNFALGFVLYLSGKYWFNEKKDREGSPSSSPS